MRWHLPPPPAGPRGTIRRSATLPSAGIATRLGAVVLLAGLALPMPSARASEAGRAELEQWLQRSVALPDGRRLRVEVRVGTLPATMKLPPCRRAEPFLPPNARLWGRASVGLRCVDGASWKTYLPVQVSAFGPALVAKAALGPAASLDPARFTMAEVDWAALPSPPVAEPAELAGKELVRPLAAGQPILTAHLREPYAVRSGETVPVTFVGNGFEVRTEGIALSNGSEGQPMRVRTPQGKQVLGTIVGKSVRIVR